MEKSQMKNMVVLKNLPSNLIEEAIIIFKTNKYIKKTEYIEKKDTLKSKEKQTNNNNYIIREAESVISNYINNLEKKEKKTVQSNIHKKYKKLKIYSILVTIALLIILIT